MDRTEILESLTQRQGNNAHRGDQAVHDWYQLVLSFPPHLVCDYLRKFEVTSEDTVLDPFCGTGTTLVECKKLGIPSVGIEAVPMARFANQVKLDWTPSPDGLLDHAVRIGKIALAEIERKDASEQRTLDSEAERLLVKDSISPLPLHKTLVLLGVLERERDTRYHSHELLALANILPSSIGNLRFGPEVGVGSKKDDAPVVALWVDQIRAMVGDLREVRSARHGPAQVHQGDAREPRALLDPNSISAVITSPPYPNEKDYTRIVRLESVLLGFMKNRTDLRALKQTLLRSNTRNIYKGDNDAEWVEHHPDIHRIANAIESRRIELGKTSGFERNYAKVVRHYFGGMFRHLAGLRYVLRPGAHLAYVVGDQASYLRVMVRTGQILASIAESLGYRLVSIELFRTRVATATKQQLREEVVVLHWPGGNIENGQLEALS